MKRALVLILALLLTSCQRARDSNTVVFLIESHPANLDPRIGTDAQSERIDQLIFDGLVDRDENFRLRPSLAESWEVPDPLTYIFHLRQGVLFHDGRPLTSRDVKYTFTSMLEGKVVSIKAATFRPIRAIETPGDFTLIIRLSEPFSSFLWNVAQGALGVIPDGAPKDFATHPVGTGAFRFVRQTQDEEVVLEANRDYWRGAPKAGRVQFKITPDSTVRALELRKGAADVAINALSADMVKVLEREPRLQVDEAPGTVYQYLALNLEDPLLKRPEVRRALAMAVDRRPLIEFLWRGQARPAASLLPPNHWAYPPDLAQVPYDPEGAARLLDTAGLPAGADGVRARLTIKTSTEESSRLLAAVVQEQLKKIGIALEIRSYEFATFYADIVKGAFQVYTLRWIGANNDPDIFDYCFNSRRIPPKGANRGRYRNPRIDSLLDATRAEMDQEKRRGMLEEIQRILNTDVPYIHLWYFDNVVVHDRRLKSLKIFPGGDYDFLKTVEVQ